MAHSFFKQQETHVIPLPDNGVIIVDQASPQIRYLVAMWDEIRDARADLVRQLERQDALLEVYRQRIIEAINGERAATQTKDKTPVEAPPTSSDKIGSVEK